MALLQFNSTLICHKNVSFMMFKCSFKVYLGACTILGLMDMQLLCLDLVM